MCKRSLALFLCAIVVCLVATHAAAGEPRTPGERGYHEYRYEADVDQGAEAPPDGDYTVYAEARDLAGNHVVVTSTLTNDTLTFASDGLASTNGALVAGEQIIVCSSHSTTDNQRQITLGAGSRVSTDRASGGC